MTEPVRSRGREGRPVLRDPEARTRHAASQDAFERRRSARSADVTMVPITIRGEGTNTLIITTNAFGFIFSGSGLEYNWVRGTNLIAAGTFQAGLTNLPMTDTSQYLTGALARIFVDNDTNQFASPVTVATMAFPWLRQ